MEEIQKKVKWLREKSGKKTLTSGIKLIIMLLYHHLYHQINHLLKNLGAIMKKLILSALVLLVLLAGCTRQMSDILVREETQPDNMSLGFVEEGLHVNDSVSYEEIRANEDLDALDVEPEDVKMVKVKPKNPQDRPLKVGFSQMEVNNPWRVCENISLYEEANRLGVELLYKDAESSIEKQNKDIIELVDQGIDYLLVAPREVSGLQEGLGYAKAQHVPVILLDRITQGVPGEDYVTCIMGDFVEVGKRSATILHKKFGDQKIHVLEISGTMGASVSRDLSKGFREVAEPLGWEITTIDGNFDKADSAKPIEEILQQEYKKVQAIFCHVDDSALVAISSLKSIGLVPGTDIEKGEIPIVSMCGYRDALKAIIAGEMLASIECSPRFGPIAFYYIQKLERGEAIKSRIVMPGKTYDASNAMDLIDIDGY